MQIPQTGAAIAVYGIGLESQTPAQNAPTAAEEASAALEEMLERQLLQEAQRRREDSTDIYDTMRKRGEEEIKQWKKMLEDIQKAREKNKMRAQPPRVNLQRLTQSLVAAVTPADVRGVLSQAGQAIGSLQIALGSLEGKQRDQVRAMIASAQKLMDRCSRKLNDLAQEDVTRGRQNKAVKTNQNKKAEAIKQELRQQMAERSRKEQRYLLDKFPQLLPRQEGLQRIGPLHPAQRLDAATEAKIEAMAQAILATQGAAAPGSAEIAAGGEAAAYGGEALEGGSGGGDAASAGEAAVTIPSV